MNMNTGWLPLMELWKPVTEHLENGFLRMCHSVNTQLHSKP